MRYQRLFRRYFIVYISFFLLLFLITVPLANLSVRALEDEARKSAGEVLASGLSRIETELDNVYKIAMTLYSEPEFYRLGSIPKDTLSPPADTVGIIRRLISEYQNLSSLLSLTTDFGIVLPNYLVLSSARVHMPAETFWGIYFRAENHDSLEEWKNALRAQAGNRMIAAMPVSSFTGHALGETKNAAVFALPLPLLGSWSTFCFATIREDVLLETLTLADMREKGTLTLYVENGDTLISQEEADANSRISIRAKSGEYRLEAKLDIDSRYFREKMVPFTRTAQAVLALFAFLGVALALFYTRRNARPMARIMDAASSVSAPPETENRRESAYDYMNRFIAQVDSRLRENRLALANQEVLIRENLMERMLRQQLYFERDWKMAREYFPDFPLPCQMALIRPQDGGILAEMEPQAFSELQIRVRQIASAHLSARAILHFSAGTLAVIQEATRGLDDIYRRILAEIEQDTGVSMLACLSLPFSRMEEAQNAFLHLRQMMRFPHSGAQVLQEGEESEKKHPQAQHLTRFYEMLSRGSLTNALDALEEDVAILRENSAPQEADIQQFFFCYRQTLCRVVNESGLDGIDLPGYNPAAALDELFGGIRACSAKVCETLCRHTEQSSSEQESALLAAVEEQLSDPLFGPETLMNRFFLSEKALQRIIKSATGMTFTEYLQHRRMEKARGMLTETELPIREICLSCGYASLNTFYKAFQRAYATAPNAMRKKAKEGSP